MIREIDENLIRPEALLSSSDMAKLGCNNCQGCSSCCRDRAEAITLDAYDVKLLKTGLNMSFAEMLNRGLIKLTVVDGIVLPALNTKAEKDECVFLKDDGRCSVHASRPGICRMFPLARIYHEDGSFSYFLQEGECERSNGVKIRIAKWLEYPNIREYEEAVRSYHDALTGIRILCRSLSYNEEAAAIQKQFLEDWFINT